MNRITYETFTHISGNGDTWIFRYRADDWRSVWVLFGQYAANPLKSWSWFDCSVATKRLKEVADVECRGI